MNRLNPRIICAYWDLVEATIREIFEKDPTSTPLYELRAMVEQLPSDAQEAFFHAEALDVAGDLLDVPIEMLRGKAAQYDRLRESAYLADG